MNKNLIKGLSLSLIVMSSIATTGCELNPFKQSEDIVYYKDVDVDEENLQYKKEVKSKEDGLGSSTLYHKTVQLPDKKISLRSDPYYVKYEDAIKDTPAYTDGNKIENVYPAVYSDLSTGEMMVTLHNDDVLLTTFRYSSSGELSFEAKNYTDKESINLRELGITIYIYDESGDTIGVYQPDVEVKDVETITVDVPTVNYCNYLGFAEGVSYYKDYYDKLDNTIKELNDLKTSNTVVPLY